MFIDTHCHLNMILDNKSFDVPLEPEHLTAIDEIVAQAGQAGVTTIINVGSSLVESKNCVVLAKRYPQVYATVGLHPCDVSQVWREELRELALLAKFAEEHKIVAIGEVGLDFYHKPFDVQLQKDAFKAQIELALEYNLALSIHVREAGDELLRVLEEYAPEIKRAVIHCFAQKQDFADIVTGWGFYLGIDAPITYPKNELLREVVRRVGLEFLVLETDSPFLPPQQYRGKTNYPYYIPLFAALVAEIKGVSLEECAAVTTKNARKLFDV